MTQPERKRGGCLTAFLVVMLIGNPLTAIYYLVAGGRVVDALPGMPAWIIPVFIVVSVANTVFAVGVWLWKRWGVFGIGVSYIVVLIINVGIGLPFNALLGLVGIAILIFLVRPVWGQME